jgi:hypothetical protein
VCLLYFFIAFRGSEYKLPCYTASFLLIDVVVLSLSFTFSNSAFYQARFLAQHNFSVRVSVVFLSFFRRIKLSNWKWVPTHGTGKAKEDSSRSVSVEVLDKKHWSLFGSWCTLWHLHTSLLLITVFPYHFLSKNFWYLYEVLPPSTVYKRRN